MPPPPPISMSTSLFRFIRPFYQIRTPPPPYWLNFRKVLPPPLGVESNYDTTSMLSCVTFISSIYESIVPFVVLGTIYCVQFLNKKILECHLHRIYNLAGRASLKMKKKKKTPGDNAVWIISSFFSHVKELGIIAHIRDY